jgi:hypothetical protein
MKDLNGPPAWWTAFAVVSSVIGIAVLITVGLVAYHFTAKWW